MFLTAFRGFSRTWSSATAVMSMVVASYRDDFDKGNVVNVVNEKEAKAQKEEGAEKSRTPRGGS